MTARLGLRALGQRQQVGGDLTWRFDFAHLRPMPLLTLTPDRVRAELERCTANERAHRAERRKLWSVAGSVVASDLLQVCFWGLSFHLVGDLAQAARAAATLCAPLPAIVLVIWQLRREA